MNKKKKDNKTRAYQNNLHLCWNNQEDSDTRMSLGYLGILMHFHNYYLNQHIRSDLTKKNHKH